MGEGRSIWVGKDEHHGVLAQPRKDLRPPPHWRLEAIAETPMPRTLTIGTDRRHVVFIEDRETSDVFLLQLDGRLGARAAHDRARPDAVVGGQPAAALARRQHRGLQPTTARSGWCPPRAALPASWSREEARAGSTPGGS